MWRADNMGFVMRVGHEAQHVSASPLLVDLRHFHLIAMPDAVALAGVTADHVDANTSRTARAEPMSG
jgi:hypothetical protein